MSRGLLDFRHARCQAVLHSVRAVHRASGYTEAGVYDSTIR